MRKDGSQEELAGEVMLLGSCETETGVRARVRELTGSHVMTAKSSDARR